MPSRPLIFDFDRATLRASLSSWNIRPFRADQLLEWVYQHHVTDPSQMSNLPVQDRRTLAEKIRFGGGRVLTRQEASDGVQKLLLSWETDLPSLAGNSPKTECVMIPTAKRRTACISSQVGCPVGCRFCASGIDGLDGNLTAGQIVEQVWQLSALSGVGRITHVVFMGMGEPLANFEAVVKAVRMLMADWSLGISGRRITISTVGLPAQIRRLAELSLPVTLAISLHAPHDELRRRLIPWAQNVSIEQLLEASDEYFAKTRREVTLEYILLRGVNDRPEHAHALARIACRLRCNVNLIRYNEVKGLPFDRPTTADVHQFQGILSAADVNTHIRASRGRDITAACGQLRHESKL